MKPFLLRDARPDDAPTLADLAARTFRETFAPNYSSADLESFLASAYSLSKVEAELSDPRYRCFVVEGEPGMLCYALLRDGSAEACVTGDDPIELERIYLLQQAHGGGWGQRLLDRCIAEAKILGRKTLWLGVWEHNNRAQAFYRRNGFEEVGSHCFKVGATEDRDLIFQKRLVQGEQQL